MSDTQKTSFLIKAKNILWPITWHENKKFLPMAAMMFFMLFNYSMLRSVKDGFVVTDIGAESISFLKTYVVFPSAIIAMIVYSKLCNVMSQQKVFYTISGFFVVYLAIFTFFIYPDPSLSHPNPELISRLSHEYPNFKWFIRIVGNWGSASFYTVSELWGSMMVSLLFWQFANHITKTEEAKRFYSMFGLLANFSLPLTSVVLATFLGENAVEYFTGLKFVPVLLIAIANVLAIMALYWWINKNVLTDPTLYDPASVGGGSKKKKVKLSLGESFKMIFSSKYLGFIALLVIAYGISLNLVEGVWKDRMSELYPTREAYTAYMGQFQGYMGAATILFMLIGSNILRSVRWSTAAVLTPLMTLITGLIFFAFIYFGKELEPYVLGIFACSPLVAALTVGTIQNVLSKATKYSLFDSTKEMSYIPLDTEMKTKGKAAVDVIGGRLGKSGGGFIQSTFFILMPSFGFTEAVPYFAAFFFVIVLVWLYGVGGLSKEYNKLVKE